MEQGMSRSTPPGRSSGGGRQQQEQQLMTQEGFVLMRNKIETQKGENMILRQKLQSKSEALLILSKELEKVRVDCDDYKELTNKLQMKYSLSLIHI